MKQKKNIHHYTFTVREGSDAFPEIRYEFHSVKDGSGYIPIVEMHYANALVDRFSVGRENDLDDMRYNKEESRKILDQFKQQMIDHMERDPEAIQKLEAGLLSAIYQSDVRSEDLKDYEQHVNSDNQ